MCLPVNNQGGNQLQPWLVGKPPKASLSFPLRLVRASVAGVQSLSLWRLQQPRRERRARSLLPVGGGRGGGKWQIP